LWQWPRIISTTISYTISDGNDLIDTAQGVADVNHEGDAPVAVDGAGEVVVGITLTLDPRDKDSDPMTAISLTHGVKSEQLLDAGPDRPQVVRCSTVTLNQDCANTPAGFDGFMGRHAFFYWINTLNRAG
jgi:hypothetical protein